MARRIVCADVSELMSWVGPVTGIQRVNVSILLEAIKLDPQLQLVVYSPVFRSIDKVDKIDFLFRFDENRSVQLVSFRLRVQFKVKVLIENLKLRVPIWLRKPLIKIKRKYSATRQLFLSWLHTALGIGSVRHPFAKGDTYLILGNSWGRARITDILEPLRAQGYVRICHIVFDMIPVVRPEFFEYEFARQYALEMEKIVRNAHVVLSISNHTKADVESFCDRLKIERPKIVTIRLGDDISHLSNPWPVQELQNKNFVLCVGTIEIRKNHRLLINSWRKLRTKWGDKTPLLVLVGRLGWLVDELVSEIQNYKHFDGKIVWYRDLNDHQVAWLYQNCMCTVYPSFYEGWGLPVAESLAQGQICLASNESSIPEIGGDLVKYFSPFSEDQFLIAINEILIKGEEDLAAMREVIKKQYSPVMWKQTTLQVLKAIGHTI